MHIMRWMLVIGILGSAGTAWAEALGSSPRTGSSVEPSAVAATSAAAPVEYDFGDFRSETLATKAWGALDAADYAAVEAYTTKCIDLYEAKAVEQQASLSDFAPKEDAFNHWALNDVATSYFIRGKAHAAQGNVAEAETAFNAIIDRFGYAQAWDLKGWFWKVAEGAKDALALMETSYDYGDYSSQTLTAKAWETLGQEDHKGVQLYTKKSIELYDATADEQQAGLTDFAAEEDAFDYWALNDVATAYFILGESHLAQGNIREAQAAFNTIIERFGYAQAWDPKGWFWKVAQGASDKLTTIGTPYDFGDYTSQTLTTKGWEALGQEDFKGVEIYTRKCIELYEDDAKEQQASLTEFAPKGKAFNYWALNDVATSYFILGEALMAQERFPEAKAAFERVVNDFRFAQCWDPKGWFWKVAVGSRGRLNKILAETGS